MKTKKWKRQDQEMEGSYCFNGRFYITRGVFDLLATEEVAQIAKEIQEEVKIHNGLDYLQVYIHEDTGQKIYCIDQLNREMISSGKYKPEDNYWTMLLSSEY